MSGITDGSLVATRTQLDAKYSHTGPGLAPGFLSLAVRAHRPLAGDPFTGRSLDWHQSE